MRLSTRSRDRFEGTGFNETSTPKLREIFALEGHPKRPDWALPDFSVRPEEIYKSLTLPVEDTNEYIRAVSHLYSATNERIVSPIVNGKWTAEGVLAFREFEDVDERNNVFLQIVFKRLIGKTMPEEQVQSYHYNRVALPEKMGKQEEVDLDSYLKEYTFLEGLLADPEKNKKVQEIFVRTMADIEKGATETALAALNTAVAELKTPEPLYSNVEMVMDVAVVALAASSGGLAAAGVKAAHLAGQRLVPIIVGEYIDEDAGRWLKNAITMYQVLNLFSAPQAIANQAPGPVAAAGAAVANEAADAVGNVEGVEKIGKSCAEARELLRAKWRP